MQALREVDTTQSDLPYRRNEVGDYEIEIPKQ
jgi:hypothetical protein